LTPLDEDSSSKIKNLRAMIPCRSGVIPALRFTIYACGSGCYTVRILNIDAPEMPPKAKCEKEAKMAIEARARLAAAIDGKTVELVREGRQRDRYDRLLARVVYQGRDMGEMLISANLARKWSGHREPRC
jgi:endonuclease YncB( thermonuclease family)